MLRHNQVVAMRSFVVAFSALLVTPVGFAAQPECQSPSLSIFLEASTPKEQFDIPNELSDVVTDKVTGLMWMRCPSGYAMSNVTFACAQTVLAPQMGWKDAVAKAEDPAGNSSGTLFGFAGWRLPNVKELASIIEHGCNSPSINKIVFPDTPVGQYWTSSPTSQAGEELAAWVVDFQQGKASSVDATYFANGTSNGAPLRVASKLLFVRLVRDAP